MLGRSLLALLTFALLATACADEPKPADIESLTFADLHEELVDSGKVVDAEFEIEGEPGQKPAYRVWYWAAEGVSRYEYAWDAGQPVETTVITRERQVTYDPRDNMLSTEDYGPVARQASIPPAAGPLRAYFATTPSSVSGTAITEENHGVSAGDGRELLHLTARMEALEDGNERPKGSVYTFDVYFDTATFFPVRSEMRAAFPGQTPSGEALVLRYTRTELVERSTLPPDHFDASVLESHEVTLDEAAQLAANAPFVVFWLGNSFPAAWTSHTGRRFTEASLMEVTAPGVADSSPPDSASVSYGMPPDFASPMLRLLQQPVASAREPRHLSLIRAAGNVFPLEGFEGYIYAEYSPRGSCSVEAAQRDEACRMFPDPLWGAVVVIDGTSIHLTGERFVERDGGTNQSAFATRESIEALIPQLRPMGN